MLTMFIISKMDALHNNAYVGLACHKAGIPLGQYYDTEEQAEADCAKINKVSAIGFIVRPVDETNF